MRLKGPILVVLFAITLALAAFAAPRAMAHEGHRSAPASIALADREAIPATALGDQAERTKVGGPAASCDMNLNVCGGAGGHNDDGQACCGMVLCHVFQANTGALLGSPTAVRAAKLIPTDEQVRPSGAGGLDRPPRTV
ncbi:hypothetical protein SLNSH_23825 [Alsobacter soli]|uniref:CopL family metal-binding regulatory protein n=1 Tax=Alsobacter soli TaxID=2109933 RepID=A0A2T1HLK2_9HYPH|nr:hypothetical protein [Alsobacter soli]PSC02471.1 hypothetical protein SLNSH_23825 [Alsobacter soli]